MSATIKKKKSFEEVYIVIAHCTNIYFSFPELYVTILFYWTVIFNNMQQERVLSCSPKEIMGRNKQKFWTMPNSLFSDEVQWIRGMQSCHSDVVFYCEHFSGYCWWWVLLSSVKKNCFKWVLSSWKLWNDQSSVWNVSLMSKCAFYEISFILRSQLLLLTKPRNLRVCTFIDLYSGGLQCKSRPRYRLLLEYLCRFLQYLQAKYPIALIQVFSNLSFTSHSAVRDMKHCEIVVFNLSQATKALKESSGIALLYFRPLH